MPALPAPLASQQADDALEATLFAPTDKAFADAITALNLTAEEVLGDKVRRGRLTAAALPCWQTGG